MPALAPGLGSLSPFIKDAALARDVKKARAEGEEHIRRTAEIDERLLSEQMANGESGDTPAD